MVKNESSASEQITLTIGRAADNQIVISHPNVSSHHATLTVISADSFLLEDKKSKHGTYVQRGDQTTRIVRKYVGRDDTVLFSDNPYVLESILPLSLQMKPNGGRSSKADANDFTTEFSALRALPDGYRASRKQVRDTEKKVRLGSILLAAAVGIASAVFGRDQAFAWLPIISSAGIGILVPTLASTLLGTEDKLERLDIEFREAYRCPNKPACKYRFGNTPWDDLADQKKCPKCKVVWVA